MRKIAPIVVGFLLLSGSLCPAQTVQTNQINSVVTAVPFMTIAPDSRSSGMGDVGAATSPDLHSMHWNPSKYAFIDHDMGVALSYNPWLRKLVNDINMVYLTGFKRLDERQTMAASIRYFDLGSIDFTDYNGELLRTSNPNEFAIDLAYARQLGERWSGGIAFRYIRSDMASGLDGSKAGSAFAADISTYFHTQVQLGDRPAEFSAGWVVSNIGSKISYSNSSDKEFLPTNMRLGFSLTTPLDENNELTLSTDFNKLLVPTPQLNEGGTEYNTNNDISVISGIFRSFSDAPGGFKEELREITWGIGAEYWYAKKFAFRAGYFGEHATKGNRKYFTFGAGLRMNVFGLDFSYLIPTESNNPLANTIRFSLLFHFDK